MNGKGNPATTGQGDVSTTPAPNSTVPMVIGASKGDPKVRRRSQTTHATNEISRRLASHNAVIAGPGNQQAP